MWKTTEPDHFQDHSIAFAWIWIQMQAEPVKQLQYVHDDEHYHVIFDTSYHVSAGGAGTISD